MPLPGGTCCIGVWNWAERRQRALALLAEADRIDSVAQLVGATSLPDVERVVLLVGRLLREAVLQQSALSLNDATCVPAKQAALLDLVLSLHERFRSLLERGVSAARIEEVDLSEAARAREAGGPADVDSVEAIRNRLLATLGALA